MNATIPKIIHYCWFSNDEKPLLIRRCIDSWHKVMPDFEIKCWDANSFDFNSIPFVKEAFERKKWAFVADYIRFYAVYTEGGIYLDSDVEVKRNISSLINHNLFIGTETFWKKKLGDTLINPEAAIFGAEAGHPLLKKCMEYYESRHFVLSNGELDQRTSPNVLGEIMKREYGYEHQNKSQQLKDGIQVYPATVFCNINYPKKKKVYAIHCLTNSWTGRKERRYFYKFCKKCYLMWLYKMIEKITKLVRKKFIHAF